MAKALYYKYWGKARSDEVKDVSYHLLPYHCLDVAAVADAWWRQCPTLRQQFTLAMQVEDEEKAYTWLMFFISLHDLGKLDIRFQMKSPQTVQQLQADVFSSLKMFDNKYDHGSYGYNWFAQEIGEYGFNYISENDTLNWMQQVAGHHGRIPEFSEPEAPAFASNDVKLQDKQAREQWLRALQQHFLDKSGQTLNDVPEIVPTMLAGFCSVCDWIGSSDYFPYKADIDDRLDTVENLSAYFASRRKQAEQALNAFGVLSPKIDQGGMSVLFPDYRPRGLQTIAGVFPVKAGLTIIEAPTGSGKTETALAYASTCGYGFSGFWQFSVSLGEKQGEK